MLEQFSFWFITGLITILLFVVWYAFTAWRKSINDKLDELIKAIKDLAEISVKNTEQINALYKKMSEHDDRLNDHAYRIRNVEISCAKNHGSKLLDVKKHG